MLCSPSSSWFWFLDPVLPMLENQTSVKTEKFIFQVVAKITIFLGKIPQTKNLLGNRAENIVKTSAWIWLAFRLSLIGTHFWKFLTQVRQEFKYRHSLNTRLSSLHWDILGFLSCLFFLVECLDHCPAPFSYFVRQKGDSPLLWVFHPLNST